MSDSNPIQLNENQINGIKAGLNEIAQGCLTLIKVLTMAQIPETAKYPKGRVDDTRQSRSTKSDEVEQ